MTGFAFNQSQFCAPTVLGMRLGVDMYEIDNDDGFFDFYEIRATVFRETIAEIIAGVKKQEWILVPFNRVKKIWADYARLGFVRDIKGINNIADIVFNTIVKISSNTELCGHDSHIDVDTLEDYGINSSDEWLELIGESEYFDDDNGQLRISDYAVQPLTKLALKLKYETKPETQLFLIDQIFNIVHQRSDIASWFLKNGTNDLLELSELEV